MIRKELKRRRRRAIFTIVLLLLLQIFNGVDWNCPSSSHSPSEEATCHLEHCMEIITPSDTMDWELMRTWLLISVRRDSFFLNPILPGSIISAATPIQTCRPPGRGAGLPPEELRPQRC